MNRRNHKRKITTTHYILFALFMLAFIIRVTTTYNEFRRNGTDNWSDAKLYLSHGLSMAEGDFYSGYGSYPHMIVGPIIPLLVACSKLFFGDPIWPMLIFNCLVSSLIVIVLYKLGSFLFSDIYGFIMAVWSAFNFGIIRLNHQILKEPLLFLLLPVIVYLILSQRNGVKKWLRIIVSSLSFSVLLHTDERFFIYTPLIILAYLLLIEKGEKIKLTFMWFLILFLSMIPWTIRNYHQHGQIVILTPRTTTFTSEVWGQNLCEGHFSSEGEQIQLFERYKQSSLETIKSFDLQPRPYGKFEKYWKAFIHYWKPTYFKPTFIMYGSRLVKWSLFHNLNSIVFYGIFLPFYILGFVLSFFRRNRIIFGIAVIPFLHSLLHIIMIWPLERYRLPTVFMIVIVALYWIKEIVDKRISFENADSATTTDLPVEP